MDVDDASLSDSDESEGEALLNEGLVKCLFCESHFHEVKELLDHCESGHNCHLLKMCRQAGLCCFGYLKLINFVRSRNVTPAYLQELFNSGVYPWASEMFLKPFDEDDKLLQFDYEFHSGALEASHTEESQLRHANETIEQQQMMIEQLQSTVSSLRERNLLTLMEGVSVEPSQNRKGPAMLDDKSYFDSYAQVHIHGEMIKDKVRTDSYRTAILGNSALFQGKVVVDVGCGTGILSMFAADAGAKKVFSIDMSDIAFSAMEIVRDNGFEDRISVLHQRVEDVELPEPADILISEWMGYFLLFECMLEPVLMARDRLLSPNGIVLPDQFGLYVSAVSDPLWYDDQVGFWDDVYGYKMTCMKKDLMIEAHVIDVSSESVVSDPQLVKHFDLNDRSLVASVCCEFAAEFILIAKKECEMTAVLVHFDCGFEAGCEKKVTFSTGPFHQPTHWKQTIFPLPRKIPLAVGDSIKGSMTVRKDPTDNHALIVSLIVNGEMVAKKYEKIDHLGEGQFANVYKARSVEDDKIVAIKKIKLGSRTEAKDGINRTALREIKLLQELSHTNVIGLLDVFGQKSNVSLVFDFMDTDLEIIIKDASLIIMPAHVKAYMVMTLRGLEYLHTNWVLHRDLKPNNLLIDKSGCLKIADFGLARFYGSPNRQLTNQVVTRWYRAPELLLGAKRYGTGVDIWAVGCILAELLLRVPFLPGESDIDQLAKIFDTLGTPKEKDWPNMKCLPDFVEFKPCPGTPLSHIFTAAGTDLIELLTKCFTYEPLRRCTCTQALQMVYFVNKPYPAKGDDLPLPGKNVISVGNTRKRTYEGDELNGSVKKRINF